MYVFILENSKANRGSVLSKIVEIVLKFTFVLSYFASPSGFNLLLVNLKIVLDFAD